MDNSILKGLWKYTTPVPSFMWRRRVKQRAEKARAKLDFMTDDHHRVRNFVVEELPRAGAPLSPEAIAEALDLNRNRVVAILEELEKGMVFLFRNPQGEVTWAYPVTVDQTPHRLHYSTGEQGYAAWAVDAFATPFVQGRLRKQPLSVEIRTECACCSKPMILEVDSDMKITVHEPGASPLIFIPEVNFETLQDPSIINAFWRNSVFFWSEEHAKDYRKKKEHLAGGYLTPGQIAYITPLVQGAVFGFDPD